MVLQCHVPTTAQSESRHSARFQKELRLARGTLSPLFELVSRDIEVVSASFSLSFFRRRTRTKVFPRQFPTLGFECQWHEDFDEEESSRIAEALIENTLEKSSPSK